jgi:hypothetical protein
MQHPWHIAVFKEEETGQYIILAQKIGSHERDGLDLSIGEMTLASVAMREGVQHVGTYIIDCSNVGIHERGSLS